MSLIICKCCCFFFYSIEMSNGTSYIDDIITKENSDTIIIKLQSDNDGRYGFNVKVINKIFRSMINKFLYLGWW